MVHECNINCNTMDINTAEALGIDDPGRWVPFIIDLDDIYAAKEVNHDTDETNTAIFCYDTDIYIIDTPFNKFKKLFINSKNQPKI